MLAAIGIYQARFTPHRFHCFSALKYSATKSIFRKAIRLERRLSEIIYFVIAKMTPKLICLPFLFITFCTYFTTDLGSTAIELPWPMWWACTWKSQTKERYEISNAFFQRLPFDWRNPLGYVVAVAIQYTMTSYATIIGSAVIAIGIGSYLYVIASCKCIKGNLMSISHEWSTQNIFDQFIEFIEFHKFVKQLRNKWNWSIIFYSIGIGDILFIVYCLCRFINDLTDIFQHLLTIVFVWCFVTICGAMLMILLLLV